MQGFPLASVAGTPMVKSLCTTESCLKPERGVYAGLCVGLLAACVKIDSNTSIPQSLLATIHTGGEKQAVSS